MNITERIEGIENAAIDLVAKIAPWAAPLPTAYLVGRATIVHLAWPSWVGIVAALVVEALGLAITATTLDLYRFNATKRKSDPAAPLGLPLVLIGVYFFAAELLTVILDLTPKLSSGAAVTFVDGAPAVFPVLSLAGMTTLALRFDHKRRLNAIEADKIERSNRRSNRRSQRQSKPVQVDARDNGKVNAEAFTMASLNAANQTRRTNKEQALNDLVNYFERNPNASYSQAGRSVDRSKSWVAGAVNDLETAGRLRKNGNGWEVL